MEFHTFTLDMKFPGRKAKFYFLSFLKHDLKASITVFFVALPLCLGVALASNAPVISGLLAGIIGGVVVSLFSNSQLSVSGPAAGLTAICAAAITKFDSLEIFYLSVTVAGVLQFILGLLKLGGFTHFIPASVIKGMLSAIGIILISKQIPPLIGYDRPEFWSNEFFNIITLNHAFQNVHDLLEHSSAGAILIAGIATLFLIAWKKYLAHSLSYLPASFLVVILGILSSLFLKTYMPSIQLAPSQFVSIPDQVFSSMKFPDLSMLLSNSGIWQTGVIICFVASLETLLSLAAIDKLDPYNRISSSNKELMAQGTGNFVSGLLGGLPITAVIVRSSANAEAKAKTKLSAIFHAIWILIAISVAVPLINMIPYCVLAVILLRTGYNLVKPKMVKSIYRQGKEQFLPFIVTVIAILLTDLLIGVLIGIIHAIYYSIKHTYLAGFTLTQTNDGHNKQFTISLALNVSFLSKKRFIEMLDKIPEYSVVLIDGSKSNYIDRDVLEIFQEFKAKARQKHIQLELKEIPDVEIIELH
ncbi:MAG TPA: SulP family inorganic anion transporter [Bacteroidia bacterium]|nr:SulP family inorganic anion transporter [Bacteroidia bacterium]